MKIYKLLILLLVVFLTGCSEMANQLGIDTITITEEMISTVNIVENLTTTVNVVEEYTTTVSVLEEHFTTINNVTTVNVLEEHFTTVNYTEYIYDISTVNVVNEYFTTINTVTTVNIEQNTPTFLVPTVSVLSTHYNLHDMNTIVKWATDTSIAGYQVFISKEKLNPYSYERMGGFQYGNEVEIDYLGEYGDYYVRLKGVDYDLNESSFSEAIQIHYRGYMDFDSIVSDFYFPSDMDYDSKNKNLYIADNYDRVKVIDLEGNLIDTFEGYDSDWIAVDSERGFFYLTDTFAHSITKFTLDGQFVKKWGAYGTGPTDFKNPKGIAVNPENGDLYIADYLNNRIMVHSANGSFIRVITDVMYPESIEISNDKIYVGCKTAYGSVVKMDLYGENRSNFGSDIDIATKGVAIDNNIFVADWKNNRVIVYDSTYVEIAQFGGNLDGEYGSGKGEMHEPTAILKIKDKVYVLEKSNHRLQVFKP